MQICANTISDNENDTNKFWTKFWRLLIAKSCPRICFSKFMWLFLPSAQKVHSEFSALLFFVCVDWKIFSMVRKKFLSFLLNIGIPLHTTDQSFCGGNSQNFTWCCKWHFPQSWKPTAPGVSHYLKHYPDNSFQKLSMAIDSFVWSTCHLLWLL